MKKLAARDYEDILQVCSASIFWGLVNSHVVSALYQSSKASFLMNRATKKFQSFCTVPLSSMHLQNYDFILTKPLPILKLQPRSLGSRFGIFVMKFALGLTLWSFLVKLISETAERLVRVPLQGPQLHSLEVGEGKR